MKALNTVEFHPKTVEFFCPTKHQVERIPIHNPSNGVFMVDMFRLKKGCMCQREGVILEVHFQREHTDNDLIKLPDKQWFTVRCLSCGEIHKTEPMTLLMEIPLE